jgi:nitrite reductase (NO-forming)
MSEIDVPAAVRQHSDWPKTALRVGFGLIWFVDAWLKWLPGFRASYMDTIMGQADGQPGWLKPWFNFWINVQHPAPMAFAYSVAVIETLIALALIFGFARKFTYLAAIVFSLLIWSTAEAFGGPYTAGAADIGTAVIYALVFTALLSFSYYQGPARYSLDAWLERRISWWHWIAEVGAHNHHQQQSLVTGSIPPPRAALVSTSAEERTPTVTPPASILNR